MMKKLLWFLVPFIVAFAAGFFYLSTNTLEPATSTLLPSQSPDILFENPPAQSLKGQIVSKTGDVSRQARTATESAKLEDSKPVLQGEEFETGDNGSLSILFTNVLSVLLSPKSKITFAQTLPQNLVLVQNGGTIDYKQEGTNIVSIRALSLLIRGNSARIKVQVDEENQSLTASVISGSITVAYDDLNHASHLKNITSGEKLIFDETTRTIKVQ